MKKKEDLGENTVRPNSNTTQEDIVFSIRNTAKKQHWAKKKRQKKRVREKT